MLAHKSKSRSAPISITQLLQFRNRRDCKCSTEQFWLPRSKA